MASFAAFASATQRASRGLARIELFLCQLLILGFAGLLLVNVVMRYAFNAPLYFAEETAVYILIWMAFLAIAATIARREMIALTFVVDALSQRWHWIADVVVQLLILAMLLVLLPVSWQWLNAPAVGFEMALTLGMKKQPFYAIIPLFFALAAFHTLANLLGLLARPGRADREGDARARLQAEREATAPEPDRADRQDKPRP